jgi:hypothetical protein
VPRLFGRLWRSGGRRAQVPAEPEPEAVPEDSDDPEEIERRIEAARQRLRETIPPPEDPEPGDPEPEG